MHASHATPPVEPSAPSATSDSLDAADWAQVLIHARQTVLPKRLESPGPSPEQLQQILAAASAAPDHGRLTPWRFVLIPASARPRLATVFQESLLARDAHASEEQLAQAAEKAYRAPTLALAIAQTHSGDNSIDSAERMISTGCAIQNMLLMATALGFGSALTSGKALRSAQLASLFTLAEGEVAVCFLSFGSVRHQRAIGPRPEISAYVSTLPDAAPGDADAR